VEAAIASETKRRILLLLGCLGFLALAILTLSLTADATPSHARRLFGLWRTRDVLLAIGLLLAASGLLAAAISRRALLAFLAINVSMGGGLALLEAAGVLGFVSWPALLTPRMPEIGTKPIPHLDISGTTYQDTASRWGLPSEPISFRYRTDRHGYRNEVDRSDADIYLVGDSVLVAALIPFSDTVTARLEKAIGRPVMQIALIGKDPHEEQQLFRDARLDVRGRLVIQFIFEGNDLRDSTGIGQAANRRVPTSWGRETLSQQVVLVLQRLTQPVAGTAALRSCTIDNQMYTFLWARESFAGREGEAAVLSDELLHFAAEIRAAGGEFGVVFVPTKLRVLGPLCRFPAGSELSDFKAHLSPLRDFLQAWSQRSGVQLLDLTDSLVDATRLGRIPWFWGDTHWNAEGHAVAAKALVTWDLVQKFRAR
jgi:hypothetical protein